MMLISTLIALSAIPTEAHSSIVSTSMFKNGYAMVLREIPINGSGDYKLSQIPAASLGTLWFAGTGAVQIDSIAMKSDAVTSMTDATSMNDLIAANIGHELRFGVRNGDKVTGDSITGKLVSAAGDVLVVKTAQSVVALNKAEISSIESPTGDLIYQLPSASSHRALNFSVKGKGAIEMISLEKGITWSPGYSVDISSKDKLTLVAKATVLNDDENLKDVTAKFVTGFPNVPYAAFQDPLISGESVDQFLGLMSSDVAPMAAAPPGGGRGFGARASLKSAMANQAMAPMEMGKGMTTSPVAGQQLEDLFFYEQPHLTLGTGERSFYVLFRMEAPYKQIYTCDLPDPVQNNVEYTPISAEDQNPDVWHTLSFKNTSGKPLTTAPATTFKDGEIMGQDMMDYVSSGADADLKVTKALDVRCATTEEEVSRERGAIKNAGNYPLFDLVTLKGTVQVNNSKSEPVTLRIRHDFTGELTSADGDPVTKKTAKNLRDTNGSGRITWNKTIESGKSLTLTYTYRLYVRSQ